MHSRWVSGFDNLNTTSIYPFQAIRMSLLKADRDSPSFLFDLSKLLLHGSKLDIDLQVTVTLL